MNVIYGFIGDFSLSDLERACPAVGRDWIRKLLQRLKTEGKVEALGTGRFGRWRKIQWGIIDPVNTLLGENGADVQRLGGDNSLCE
jgi:hypothetical protein